MKNNIISKFFYCVCALVLIWLFFSWAEISIKNKNLNPTYNKYNAFIMVMELSD